MKFFILVYLFISSLDSFLSSPVAINVFDVYNDAREKLKTPMKEILPETNDYFAKIMYILKNQAEKSDENSFVSSKPTEDEKFTRVNSIVEKKILYNKTKDHVVNGPNRPKANKIIMENHFNKDFDHETPAAVFIGTGISSEMPITRDIEKISEDKHFLNDTMNEYDLKTRVNNFSQKEKSSDGNISETSKTTVTDHGNHDFQLHQAKFSTGVNSLNKRSIIAVNSKKVLLKNRSSEISDTNSVDSKDNQHDNGNVSRDSKPEFINENENNHEASKANASTKESSENYSARKVEPTISAVGLITQDETSKMTSEKSRTEILPKNQENSDGKISSVISNTGHSKQVEKESTKALQEISEETKLDQNGKGDLKNNLEEISNSTFKLPEPDVKSKSN